jgi:hypothetical protein
MQRNVVIEMNNINENILKLAHLPTDILYEIFFWVGGIELGRLAILSQELYAAILAYLEIYNKDESKKFLSLLIRNELYSKRVKFVQDIIEEMAQTINTQQYLKLTIAKLVAYGLGFIPIGISIGIGTVKLSIAAHLETSLNTLSELLLTTCYPGLELRPSFQTLSSCDMEKMQPPNGDVFDQCNDLCFYNHCNQTICYDAANVCKSLYNNHKFGWLAISLGAVASICLLITLFKMHRGLNALLDQTLKGKLLNTNFLAWIGANPTLLDRISSILNLDNIHEATLANVTEHLNVYKDRADSNYSKNQSNYERISARFFKPKTKKEKIQNSTLNDDKIDDIDEKTPLLRHH